MAEPLSLRIRIVKTNALKMMQFDEAITVQGACQLILERIPEAGQTRMGGESGLFKADEDPKKGRWLETDRALDYYGLKNGDVLEFRVKIRPLRVKTVDGTVKTVLVDDSHTVKELINTVAEKIGLQNPEEYSFITEEDLERPLKKAQKGVRGQKQLEKIRKKWHTDDELHWLAHDKSLREQGVDETEVLVLKKRLFFQDMNIDQSDPIQVNLLYAQVKEDILDGTHPVSRDEAVHLAALQCQATYGNFNEAKHKPGFLPLPEFLPKEYVKVKGMERAIYQEYRKHYSLSELNAKFRYIQMCRAMPTYGVTFFLVKEKLKGRNKLVPRLLGISRSSIMRIDENTKEVLQRWELTSVRRWAASTNSFTLDFGDYREGYYSVQTAEGELVSQLLGSYIDLILRANKPIPFQPKLDDDDDTIVEGVVSGQTGTVTQLVGGGQKAGTDADVNMSGTPGLAAMTGDFSTGEPDTGQGITTGPVKHDPDERFGAEVAEMRRLLRGDIDGNEEAVSTAMQGLFEAHPGGGSADVARENISATVAAILASAASVLALTEGDPAEANYAGIGSAVATSSSNLDELIRACRMLSAMDPDSLDGDGLKDAAKNLADAMGGLFNYTRPENWEDREELRAAAEQIARATAVLLQLCESGALDHRTQEVLSTLATAVASSTQALITHAQKIASLSEDQAMKDKIYAAIKETADATQGLLTAANMVGSSADYSLCQEQLTEACKKAIGKVEKLVLTAQCACDDDNTLKDLGVAAKAVTESLNDLLGKLKEAQVVGDTTRSEEAYQTLVKAAESLLAASPQEMMQRARDLADAAENLLRILKLEADDRDMSALLEAAKLVMDASTRVMDASKVASKDSEARELLQSCVEDLQTACASAVSVSQRRAALRRLRAAAKNAYAANVQLIAASFGARAFNPDEASLADLLRHCEDVSKQLEGLAKHLRASGKKPDSPHTQLALIGSSQAVLLPSAKMVQAAKNTVPHVENQSASLQLANMSRLTTIAISNLKNAVDRASDVCGSLEIECALEAVHDMSRQIDGFKEDAANGRLVLEAGETLQSSALELGAAAKAVGSAMAQLLAAADQGNESYTGKASRETAKALQRLTDALHGVAAGSTVREDQNCTLEAGTHVMQQSEGLLKEVKSAVDVPNQPNKKLRLAQSAKALSQALNEVVNCLPGQREMEEALKIVNQAMQEAESVRAPKGQPYQALQNNVSAAASELNSLANELPTTGRTNPDQLAPVATAFAKKFQELVHAGMSLAAASQDKEMEKAMLGHLRSLATASSKILLAAKTLGADPSAPNAWNQLSGAARGVTDSINDLLSVLSSAAPGQKECDDALRKITAMQGVLESPAQPLLNATFFPCLETVVDMTQGIGKASAALPGLAKGGEFAQFGETVTSTGDSVCHIVEAAAHAAYLVGISDPTSRAAEPGLVDQTRFGAAKEAIASAIHTISDPHARGEEILNALGVITRQGGYLISTAKGASQATANPVAKNHFAEAAKSTLLQTEAVVRGVKAAVKPDGGGAHTVDCKPLMDAVSDLVAFASSPSFATTPAVIGEQGREAMSPILSAGQATVAASKSLLANAKDLAVNPNDPELWRRYSAHSKALTEAMRSLLGAIKDKSPGQEECDAAIDTINKAIADLDRASMAALTRSLPTNTASSLNEFHGEMRQELEELKAVLRPLSTAATEEAENLGHRVTAFANVIPRLSTCAIGAASRTKGQQQQTTLLEQTKTVAESAGQMAFACKSAGGNPKSSEHGKVVEAVDMMKEAIGELEETLQKTSKDLGFITQMIERVQEGIAMVANPLAAPGTEFTTYHNAMMDASKTVAKKVQEVSQLGQDTAQTHQEVVQLVDGYCRLAEAGSGAIATAESQQLGDHLKLGMQSLGEALATHLAILGTALSEDDPKARKDLVNSTKAVKEKMTFVLSTLKTAAKGAQACEEAATAISGMSSDLETTAMFASYGAWKSDAPAGGGAFGRHHDGLVKLTAELQSDLQNIASSVSSQDQLAVAAQKTAKDMEHVTEVTKQAAGTLGDDADGQVSLLNAAKDVANSLVTVLEPAKTAAGKSPNDPAVQEVKAKAKEAAAKVDTFSANANKLRDLTGRATRTLQQTIAAIEAELERYDSSEMPAVVITPENLLHLVNSVMTATARAVSACNSQNQDELVTAAALGKKMVDLLRGCKVAASMVAEPPKRDSLLKSGKACTMTYLDLLKHVDATFANPTPEKKKQLLRLSEAVAKKVVDLTKEVEALKGEDWVNPNDPAVIAENELLKAAASIEAAARKLEELQPRREVTVDESLTFNEQIVEAAKSIAKATNGLIRAARDAQKELVAQGKLKKLVAGSEESQFADGLISAAKQVAESTSILCDSANGFVTGESDEDELISATKSVASSTTSLLIACNVKAEWRSKANERLQDAGSCVKKATDHLVQSAQRVKEKKEAEAITVGPGGVPGIKGGAQAGSGLYQKTRNEWLARADVYKIEKELAEARKKLDRIRKGT